ncbi:MAG: flagellar hook protein FlgE [Candidatus Kapabacteria bacterium]|nr:flagellar hook protein FlgE [Candidatus Kapabacteria bacterium]MCS7169044.1 flagellar hook protein FlgE [Candidatus Kapabacteria bacterium]MDW7997308.1 flagellar hook protein FlgE [Bacteroidota bacterium]MDW8224721.1 flagellar hook protein FlgE [Bacteroidota bacterium]
MGLSQSLTTAQSALRAHQQRLDVIANNVANVNTLGYKASRARFAEYFARQLRMGTAPEASAGLGGIDPLQIGMGVYMASIFVDMSQGALTVTNRPLDMALQGEGFFVVRLNGQQRLTRAGVFTLDAQGNLVDAVTGALVQGYNALFDAEGRLVRDNAGSVVLSRRVDALRLPPGLRSPARQTEQVRVAGNLSAGMTTGESIATSILIYDARGGTHELRLEFRKTSNPNEFELSLAVDGRTVRLPASATLVRFRADGGLEAPRSFTVSASELNTAVGASSPVFDTTRSLTVHLAPSGTSPVGVTNLAGGSTISFVEQDGYGVGELVDLQVEPNGKLVGSFTNGRTEVLGQLVIAKVMNPGGLVREGDNLFAVSPSSGSPVFGTAGELFPTTRVIGGAVEEANVDLTTEFTELIATQRAFEAAARAVAVSDQILVEINALKR